MQNQTGFYIYIYIYIYIYTVYVFGEPAVHFRNFLLCSPSQRSARSQVPSQVATHQEIASQLWAGETPDSNPGLQDNSLAGYHWATTPPKQEFWMIFCTFLAFWKIRQVVFPSILFYVLWFSLLQHNTNLAEHIWNAAGYNTPRYPAIPVSQNPAPWPYFFRSSAGKRNIRFAGCLPPPKTVQKKYFLKSIFAQHGEQT